MTLRNLSSVGPSLGLALGFAVAGLLLGAVGVRASEAPPTNGELGQRLLDDVLAPVVAALESEEESWGIALRPSGAATADRTALREAIGNFFVDRGYEVWTPADSTVLPEGALVLEFDVDEAALDYPRRQGGFLGFGAGHTMRRAVLGVEGRLRDNRDGRWVWRGAPRRQVEDWIETDQLERVQGDEPAWMSAARTTTDLEPSTSWWERGLVAGLLGSVVIIYFDGAQ